MSGIRAMVETTGGPAGLSVRGFTSDVNDASLTWVPVVTEPLLDLVGWQGQPPNELVDPVSLGELTLQEALLGIWQSSPWSPCPTL